jgi:hypothetical protein
MKDLRALLRQLIEAEIPVQFLLGNDGLVQGAEIRPSWLREHGDRIYLGDSVGGLQFRIARLSEVFFRLSYGSSDWALKAYEPEGRLACTIAPARGSSPEDRKALLVRLKVSLSGSSTEW